ncbi:MAG: REP-associated tyrosine transposase [Patescibacteria group bacterium]|nr:REP-associated tyrosine transposase [Patescibacteria group bacterium]
MPYKNRKSNRLENYDYSQNGMYFVTICTKDRVEHFGEIKDGKMILNESGEIALKNLRDVSNHFESVCLDEYVVMPNHLHCILEIDTAVQFLDKPDVGVQFIEPVVDAGFAEGGFDKSNPYAACIGNNPMLMSKTTLGKIIRYCKAKTACEIRGSMDFWQFAWQKNYYDHIVRNEISLNKIREYIQENPKTWERDRNNVENLNM